MLSRLSTTTLCAVAFAQLAFATPLASTEQACKDIQGAVPGKLFYPHDRQYGLENTDYYNIGLAALMPACIVQPTTPQEVSAVVKILNKYTDVPFAVKSGGHDPNEGHSSVKGGVLIALSQMNGAVYDKEKNVIRFKPGGHWSEVIGTLDKQGVAVVGGRLGEVGVGGLIMQGGLSFLSSQYGLAADNILEYEMVLANGTIAKINAQAHKELVTAIRGGGDQFGIATEFTAKAHKMGQVWGGLRIYTGTSKNALYDGLHGFVRNQTDTKSAVIFTHLQPAGLFSIYMLFFFYDGPNPPKGAWGKLGDIKPALDLCKQRSYPDMLSASNIGATNDNGFSAGLLSGLSSFGSTFFPGAAAPKTNDPAAAANPLGNLGSLAGLLAPGSGFGGFSLPGAPKSKDSGAGANPLVNPSTFGSGFLAGLGSPASAAAPKSQGIGDIASLLGGFGSFGSGGGLPSSTAPKSTAPKRFVGFQGAEGSQTVPLEISKTAPVEYAKEDVVAYLRERYIRAIADNPPPSTATTPPRSLSLGQRTSFRSLTLPLIEREWFSEIESVWSNTVGAFSQKNPAVIPTFALQPLPNLIGKQSEANGGNSMSLKGTDPPRFIIEIAWQWKDKTLDAQIDALSRKFAETIKKRSEMHAAQSATAGTYFPDFMNDAAGDQNVTESYKDKAKFSQLQKSVDPNGFWKRTGSFKYA